MVTTTQELGYNTRNFVHPDGYYLGDEVPLFRAMSTWPCHNDSFYQHYNKAFVGNPFFVAYIVDQIRKRVQFFLHFCNTRYLDDMEMVSLLKFGKIQRYVERSEWMTYTPVWLYFPTLKEGGGRNSVSGIGGIRGQVKQKMEADNNRDTDPQLMVMEKFGEFFNPACRKGHLCPMSPDGREIYI